MFQTIAMFRQISLEQPPQANNLVAFVSRVDRDRACVPCPRVSFHSGTHRRGEASRDGPALAPSLVRPGPGRSTPNESAAAAFRRGCARVTIDGRLAQG